MKKKPVLDVTSIFSDEELDTEDLAEEVNMFKEKFYEHLRKIESKGLKVRDSQELEEEALKCLRDNFEVKAYLDKSDIKIYFNKEERKDVKGSIEKRAVNFFLKEIKQELYDKIKQELNKIFMKYLEKKFGVSQIHPEEILTFNISASELKEELEEEALRYFNVPVSISKITDEGFIHPLRWAQNKINEVGKMYLKIEDGKIEVYGKAAAFDIFTENYKTNEFKHSILVFLSEDKSILQLSEEKSMELMVWPSRREEISISLDRLLRENLDKVEDIRVKILDYVDKDGKLNNSSFRRIVIYMDGMEDVDLDKYKTPKPEEVKIDTLKELRNILTKDVELGSAPGI